MTKAAKPPKPAKSDAQTVLSSLPDDLKTEALQLASEIDKLKEDDIRKRYELGTRLRSIRDDKTGRYGTDPLAQIQKVMPLSKDGLRPMLALAEAYTDAELNRLLALRHPATNERLTWTHVVSLSRVKDKEKAYKLAERTVAEGWASRDLHRQIVKAHGGPRAKGGRKIKRATTFADAVTDVAARTATWNNAVETVWTAPQDGLVDLYDKQAAVPGYRPDAATAEAVGNLATQLLSTQLRIAGLLQQVVGLKHRVDAARTARAAE